MSRPSLMTHAPAHFCVFLGGKARVLTSTCTPFIYFSISIGFALLNRSVFLSFFLSGLLSLIGVPFMLFLILAHAYFIESHANAHVCAFLCIYIYVHMFDSLSHPVAHVALFYVYIYVCAYVRVSLTPCLR